MKNNVSIVIPAKDEEDTIGKVLNELNKTIKKLLIIILKSRV